MNSDSGFIENVFIFIVIAVIGYWVLKFVGLLLLKWTEICGSRLEKHPKICTAAMFSPPVVFTAIMAYMAAHEGSRGAAGFSWMLFLVFFVGIGMGTMLLVALAVSIADR